MEKVTLLLIALVLSICSGQFLSNPKRVYSNIQGVTIKQIGAASTTCSVTLVILDDSADCLKFANADGVVYDTQCTPSMANAFDFYGYASAGYLLTNDNNLVIFDMYSGDEIGTMTPAILKAQRPFKIGLYTSFAVPTATHTWFLADGATNTTTWLPNWTINGFVDGSNKGTSNSYGSSMITYMNNTKPIKCMFTPQGGKYWVVYEDSDYIEIWNWIANGKYDRTFTGYGKIAACGGDYYNRAWIWDLGCNCLKVLNTTGGVIQQVNLPEVVGTPKNLVPTRNKLFIHDDNGIVSYDYAALTATFTPNAVPTCASTSTPVNIQVSGGSPPYTTRILPDQTTSVTANIIPSFSLNYTANVLYKLTYDGNYTIFDDAVASEFEATPSNGVSSLAPASELTPKSGQYSWKLLMSSNFEYGFRASTVIPGFVISSTAFETLEFWVYLTPGVTKFRVNLNPSSGTFFRDYVGLPTQVWTKISIPLALGKTTTALTYNKIDFEDTTNSTSTTSFIYVDGVRLLSFDAGIRKLAVVDFCDAAIVSNPFPNSDANVLKASVTSQNASCFDSQDGSFIAVATGGSGSYNYTWNFDSSNNAALTGRGPVSVGLKVFENYINSNVFEDLSSGTYAFNDATLFHSSPYSISLVPEGAQSYVILHAPKGISTTTYKALEFWVNGGTNGGQLVYASLINNVFTPANPALVHRLIGTPVLSPNTWIKVSLPIPADLQTFYGVIFSAAPGIVQGKIYFDDINLVYNNFSLTVMDSANCKVTVTDFKSIEIASSGIAIAPQVTNAKCYNSKDGVVKVNVTGGVAPYSYTWTNAAGQSSDTATGLGESVYTVTVAGGCTVSKTVQVLQPPVLTVALTQAPVCPGRNASISAQVSGGIAPYSFTWTSTAPFSVKSAPSPISIFEDKLVVPKPFTFATGAQLETICNGSVSHSGYCVLSVTPSATNNTLFSIGCNDCLVFSQFTTIDFWVNLVNPAVAPSLDAIFYDDGDITVSVALQINATAGWQKIKVSVPATGKADTFVIVSTGSQTPGRILVDTVTATPSVSTGILSKGSSVYYGYTSSLDVVVGKYTLAVSDGNACPATLVVDVVQPPALDAKVTLVGKDTLTTNVTGGTSPYTYKWSHNSATTPSVPVVKNLYTYSVLVTDYCGNTFTYNLKYNPNSASSVVLSSVVAVFAAILLFL